MAAATVRRGDDNSCGTCDALTGSALAPLGCRRTSDTVDPDTTSWRPRARPWRPCREEVPATVSGLLSGPLRRIGLGDGAD